MLTLKTCILIVFVLNIGVQSFDAQASQVDSLLQPLDTEITPMETQSKPQLLEASQQKNPPEIHETEEYPGLFKQPPDQTQCGLSHTMAWAECAALLPEPCPTLCTTPDNCQFPYCDSSRKCKCEKVWCKKDLMCRFFRIPCAGNFTCLNSSCICEI